MAQQSIYGTPGGAQDSKGINPFGFKSQPVQDNNSMANFLQSNENSQAARGSQLATQGQGAAATGIAGLAPVMDYLTKLTKGDQADVTQATQPEANRIRDSFTAIRNIISSQPRGGGKAGALAEAPFKQNQQINDQAQQARQGAAGELGQVSSTLAGIGVEEAGLGGKFMNDAQQQALEQRGQNMTSGSFASQFEKITQGINNLI